MDELIYSIEDFYYEFTTFFQYEIGEEVMAGTILLLSAILFVIRLVDSNIPKQGISYIASNSLFLLLCAVEIIYIISMEKPMWFCTPDRVGWLWSIVNFILLGGIILNQIIHFGSVISDLLARSNVRCDIRLGLYSWIGALICLILCGFFFQVAIPWVLLALGVLQIIQLIIVFWSYGKKVKSALFFGLVYLLGTIGTAVITILFVGIVVFVALFIAVAWLVLKLVFSNNWSNSKKGRIRYSDGSSEEATVEKGILGETYYKGKDTGNQYVD